MENKIYQLSDSEFIDLIKSSLNISEVLFKLGYSTVGNSWGYSQIKQRMQDLNLSGNNFRGKSILKSKKFERVDPNKLLCENSKHTRLVLRRYIISHNLLPYKCAICGIKEWNGKTLSLELDHINGINNDNRIENLRFLCPNCHSQTTTYGARNKQLIDSHFEITDELRTLIINKYLELKNKKKVSKILNLQLKAVSKVISEAGLNKPNQKYVIQYDFNHNEIRRFGSISECCNWLMDNNIVTTKLLKTCRNSLLRNIDKLWNNYYFSILDA